MDFVNHRLNKNLLVYSEPYFTKKVTVGKRKVSGLKQSLITMISAAASSQLISEVCLCPRFSGEETDCLNQLDIDI